jgi:malonate transporter
VILALVTVILPVFLVIAFGAGAVRARLISAGAIDGVMLYAQGFALPCVLFRGIVELDLGAVFDWRLLGSFYTGAILCFVLGVVGARKIFHARPGESVAIGFAALFSNSLLLGIPIMSRAYGVESLAPNFAIISIHAPLCYLIGITAMEVSRADGRGLRDTARAIAKALFRNALMIGLGLGFIVNLSGLPLPEPLTIGVDMIADSALPAALFGLGGVLTRYSLKAQLGEAGLISGLSLIVHPAVAFVLSHHVFGLPPDFVRSAVVTAAMAPGVNAYVFASLYARAQAEAASAVLLATGLSVVTVTGWLALLDAVL